MELMHTKPILDCKTLLAILNADPDGVAILGAWNSMETLAMEDPESCVRLSPGLPMDNSALAALLRCTESIVEKTIDVFGKLKRIAVKDGVIKVLGLNEAKAVTTKPARYENANTTKEEALAKKREQDRIRQASRRARLKKIKETGVKENVTTSVTGDRQNNRDGQHDTCDNQRDTLCDVRDMASQSRTATEVTPMCDMRDGVRDMRDNSYIYNGNINKSIYPLHAYHAHKHISKYDNLISLNELPEEYRNVIAEWNKLPLPKFRGLIPEMLDKLKYLMKKYGESTLCKTIAGIANNAFLLGRKYGKTWSISLGWLLEPANFAKVLSGKYRDDKFESNSTWHPGERLPFYLPGEGEKRFTPTEQEQALRNLFIPTTPAQLKAARLIGLPGYKEATA